MAAIVGLFIILILSLTVIRIGTIALELTGLSQDVAAFQAQSAFSGTGFTTSEAENVVTHPVRRRIIRTLILIGNAGIISTGATFIVALISTNNENAVSRVSLLVAGLVVLYVIAKSKIVYKLMRWIFVPILTKMKTLQLQDYHEILGISRGYSISRMRVTADNWVAGKKLKDLALQREGTTILSILRKMNGKEDHVIPYGETEILAEDYLTVYGRCKAMDCLFKRPQGERGDTAHEKRAEQLQALESAGLLEE